MSAPITPVSPVLADARALFRLARQTLDQHISAPTNVGTALAACMFTYHLKDWREPKNDEEFFDSCPFARTIGEIANGTKHFWVTSRNFTDDPHMKGLWVQQAMGPVGSAPVGALPVGGSAPAEFVVITRRYPADSERRHSIKEMLAEALGWWDGVLT